MFMALAGGLGLFLLGMILMTDGLKALAGRALRQILTRFVSGSVSGVGWGALVTALVQSSTATTVATVGFVSAGLLTFTQAVGVIFGANLGTTSTGWIVSQLGFKVSLGKFAPPILLVGVLMYLLGKTRTKHIGQALAGFGLLFIGIDMLQLGMSDMATRFDPAQFPGFSNGGMLSRLILVGFGFAMTLIMQSSSASMATTLAAVFAGAIGYEQAAALIIGHNIGTTPTAIAASIGAPVAAKRTAMAHVLFNLLIGGVAFVFLPLILSGIDWAAHMFGGDDAPTRLALFHTTVKTLGVLLLLPVVRPFSRAIERILPDRAPKPTRFLAPAVAQVGPVALEAARRSLALILSETGVILHRVLASGNLAPRAEELLDEADRGVDETRRFIHTLARAAQNEEEATRHAALMHASDHLSRLIENMHEVPQSHTQLSVFADAVLLELTPRLIECSDNLSQRAASIATEGKPCPSFSAEVQALEQLSAAIAERRKSERRAALKLAASGRLDPDVAVARIEALLWLDGVAYHLWRAGHYLDEQLPTDVHDQALQSSGDPQS